jgi:imidazolonepropionase-like amidohydrolase
LYGEVLELLVRTGRWWDPTIHWGTPTESAVPGAERELVADAAANTWRDIVAGLREAWDRGVSLQIGTDGSPPALHRELQAFVAAGIPASAVLRMATLGAAEAVGASEHLGTLEAGKLADIVLLNANPLEDIRNALEIWRVIAGGRVFDRVALLREPN